MVSLSLPRDTKYAPHINMTHYCGYQDIDSPLVDYSAARLANLRNRLFADITVNESIIVRFSALTPH